MGCLKLSYGSVPDIPIYRDNLRRVGAPEKESDLKIVYLGEGVCAEKKWTNDYRYGFNGMESDDEVAGTKNSLTAEFWQYDPRIGRRWNVDPVVKYHESPYTTFANNPIWFIDPSGADSLKFDDEWFWEVTDSDTPESISERTGVDLDQLNTNNQDFEVGSLLTLGITPTHFIYEKRTQFIYYNTQIALVLRPDLRFLTYNGSRQHDVEKFGVADCPECNIIFGEGGPSIMFHRDVFPYSSTIEAVHFQYCDCVPAYENSRQGADLSRLYRNMQPGDVFRVKLIPRNLDNREGDRYNPRPVVVPLRGRQILNNTKGKVRSLGRGISRGLNRAAGWNFPIWEGIIPYEFKEPPKQG